ncbi:MAG: Rpn family recombination-promoting nuclease/putative transposase [Chromatiales bacterium]|nr:Rpn family recombination-promoting nuclease/putative transposase [Chromatiales bacterium]
MNHHPIDPKIDCVFKALLGSESNRALLIHFLNATLGAALPAPITEVEILNPYNDKEFLDDKLSIVDVKARDQCGSLHQIEIQLLANRDLLARILYTWADLYSSQLHSGQDYSQLKPTYAIWLLGEDLLPTRPEFAHDFRLRDTLGRPLLDHGGIWLLELNKFHADTVQTEQDRWLKFFKDGEQLDPDALPTWMNTDEMRQAMSTLKAFSDKDRAYHAYQARQNYLREQRSIQRHLEELKAEAEQQRAALEQARAEREQAQVEARSRRRPRRNRHGLGRNKRGPRRNRNAPPKKPP